MTFLVATEVLIELRRAGVTTHHVAPSPPGRGLLVYIEASRSQDELAVQVLTRMPGVGAVTFPTPSRAIIHVAPATPTASVQ